MVKVNTQTKTFVSVPVEVQAYQWFRVSDFCEGVNRDVDYFRHPDISGLTRCKHCQNMMHDHGFMETLEGEFTVCPTDYIVTGTHGEKYPVKEKIFIHRYVEKK